MIGWTLHFGFRWLDGFLFRFNIMPDANGFSGGSREYDHSTSHR